MVHSLSAYVWELLLGKIIQTVPKAASHIHVSWHSPWLTYLKSLSILGNRTRHLLCNSLPLFDLNKKHYNSTGAKISLPKQRLTVYLDIYMDTINISNLQAPLFLAQTIDMYILQSSNHFSNQATVFYCIMKHLWCNASLTCWNI